MLSALATVGVLALCWLGWRLCVLAQEQSDAADREVEDGLD